MYFDRWIFLIQGLPDFLNFVPEQIITGSLHVFVFIQEFCQKGRNLVDFTAREIIFALGKRVNIFELKDVDRIAAIPVINKDSINASV